MGRSGVRERMETSGSDGHSLTNELFSTGESSVAPLPAPPLRMRAFESETPSTTQPAAFVSVESTHPAHRSTQ